MKLYIYDHCPYCVKARMIFGFRNLSVELITLDNDDEETPTDMIGQKMVPILDDGTRVMPESMDIVRYIDQKNGNKDLLLDRPYPELEDWLTELGEYIYKLAMPRWVKSYKSGFMEEFASEGSREYFTHKKTLYIGDFDEHMANSNHYIAEVNKLLIDLEDLIKDESAADGELGESDIHLFTVLRSLSIVKGLEYPAKVENYRQNMARLSKVPLHDSIAI